MARAARRLELRGIVGRGVGHHDEGFSSKPSTSTPHSWLVLGLQGPRSTVAPPGGASPRGLEQRAGDRDVGDALEEAEESRRLGPALVVGLVADAAIRPPARGRAGEPNRARRAARTDPSRMELAAHGVEQRRHPAGTRAVDGPRSGGTVGCDAGVDRQDLQPAAVMPASWCRLALDAERRGEAAKSSSARRSARGCGSPWCCPDEVLARRAAGEITGLT